MATPFTSARRRRAMGVSNIPTTMRTKMTTMIVVNPRIPHPSTTLPDPLLVAGEELEEGMSHEVHVLKGHQLSQKDQLIGRLSPTVQPFLSFSSSRISLLPLSDLEVLENISDLTPVGLGELDDPCERVCVLPASQVQVPTVPGIVGTSQRGCQMGHEGQCEG